MQFEEFAQKLASAIRAGSSTDKFTRSLFEAVLSDEGQDILDEYKSSSYKGFYNGNTSISRIANKINAYIEPMEFSAYIENFSDATVENLCTVFGEDIPGISPSDAGEKLANLFISIITEAASTKKKGVPKDTNRFGTFSDVAPELTPQNAGSIFFISPETAKDLETEDEENDDINPFQKYLDSAANFYSTKKTLLYAEKPHPFYDLYVCNDIRYRKFHITGLRDTRAEKIMGNATVAKLENESKYIIIEGIGGIGKSMFLTHLFLSSAKETNSNGVTPLLLLLKDYKDTTNNIVEFIWKSIKEFDPEIAQRDVINALQENSLILLMDGLDEIQSAARGAFDEDLEAFIKSYPGNTIIITSRPVCSFIAYSKFAIFDIQALTKPQAIELVKKLEFWDTTAKDNFLVALDRQLYHSHYQFASNPLLLTIMLMTYSSFGEVPAKMHVFYSMAYETMARLHDATKGSFQRPLHTNLTPEEFSKYFAQFCARTYRDEVLEFDLRSFTVYMSKVLKVVKAEHQSIAPRDFLLDLTDNLCIMYREGENYYFIHRSFQEYFAAVHFASEYDANLNKVGNFFETMQHRSYSDKTFEMLYDMIPEKIERFIFLPFLNKLIADCTKVGADEEYWEFLETVYPVLYHEEGETGEFFINEAQSFLYKSIIREKALEAVSDLEDYGWPKQIYDLPTKTWVRAYSEFLEYDAYDRYPNPDLIPEKVFDETNVVSKDELPYKYSDYFGSPESEGLTIEVEIYELRKNPHRYTILRRHMEQPDFPLFHEYQDVKKYYEELNSRTQRETASDDLFDD